MLSFYSQKDIAQVKNEIEKRLKDTNEVNETTEALKKLAVNAATDNDANSQTTLTNGSDATSTAADEQTPTASS